MKRSQGTLEKRVIAAQGWDITGVHEFRVTMVDRVGPGGDLHPQQYAANGVHHLTTIAKMASGKTHQQMLT